MNAVDIMRHFIIEFENDCIPSIIFDADNGYRSNFRNGGKPSYAKRIGAEFIKNNIEFSSLYDIGHGKFDSSNDNPELQKSYVESCKNTPNNIFLQKILPFEEQRQVLLKVLDQINLLLMFGNKLCEQRFTNEDMNKLNLFFSMLDDFKNIGLDKIHINKEITSNIENYYLRGEVSNPNIAAQFIYNNFSFTEDFMQTTFKDAFFTHFTPSQKPTYDNLCCTNNKNRIKCSYYELNNELPPKEDKNFKKNKI